ncbi:MAG: hypothetical protein M5U32_02405 [Myxococcota bacterium]|nr:hypothetical protein [Myxococcota bacterium]
MIRTTVGRLLVAVGLAFAGSPATANERNDPGLPSNVDSVVSASNLDHTLRVVVLSGGFEHISSRVYFQWLVPDRESEWGSRLVASVLVQEVSGGMLSVGQPQLKSDGAGFRVVLETTDSHTLRNETFRFSTGPPGFYRVAK